MLRKIALVFVWAVLARLLWIWASSTELWANDSEFRLGVFLTIIISLIWVLTHKNKKV